MKRIKLLLLTAIVIAVSSAFATSANFGECDDQEIFGKIVWNGSDTDPNNFTPFDANDICVSEPTAICKYYYDEVQMKYVPCPDSPTNQKFQAVP